MTMNIYGNVPHSHSSVAITDKAAERAGITINPSSDETILRIRTLAAAFFAMCDEVVYEGCGSAAVSEVSVARANMSTAMMFLVQARERRLQIDQRYSAR